MSAPNRDAANPREIEARQLRVGDDLFGAGVVSLVLIWSDERNDSVQVTAAGRTITFAPDETVTIRRAA